MKRLVGYARWAIRNGDRVESTANAIQPGMVLDELEGVDWGDQQAVVLDVERDAGEILVEVLLLDQQRTKLYRMPFDTAFTAHDPGDVGKGVVPQVYDSLRMHDDIDWIRSVPDSYYPYRDPNHPNSIEETLWRPTLRRSPIYRYYERIAQEAGGRWRADDSGEMPWPQWQAKIAPCPRDGHPELRFTETDEDGWAECWGITCTHKEPGDSHEWGCEETPEEAITAWNDHVRRTAMRKRARNARRRRETARGPVRNDSELTWLTPPENQGQIVEVSYASDDEMAMKRIVDRSDPGSDEFYFFMWDDVDWEEMGALEEWWQPWNFEPDVPAEMWEEMPKALEAKAMRKRARRSAGRRRAELVREPRGYNMPKPDVFVPRLNDEGEPMVPLYPDLIGYDIDPYEPCELAEAAQDFYGSYQYRRQDLAPQYIVHSRQNLEPGEYALIYASEKGLDRAAMDVLWCYMVEIGMFPASERDAWRDQLAEHELSTHRHDDLA